ncbi:MAG: phage baseplate protein [Gammaproteobacteria bacterium]|nr:phage baseplate protein [Gammaproteobacteria bacterium]
MMRGLTPQSLLEVCEWAESEHPANRAVALLYAASPDTSWDELAALSIGRRDALLLELREKTFGRQLEGFASCLHCGERLEFAVATSDIRVGVGEQQPEYHFEYQGRAIRFRLPDSTDLVAVSHLPDPNLAGAELVSRCLLDQLTVADKAEQVMPDTGLVNAVAEQISQCDPQAEVLFDLHCPACNKDSQSLFDIGGYIWIEFTDLARRLMQQVHWLARGYGWKEADILRMSAWRRRYYQELLGL